MKVLIVDDEPILVNIVKKIIEIKYDVVVFYDACKAIDHLKTDVTYDAIICDIIMPNCTGVDLYNFLKQNRPELIHKIIFITGGSLIPGVTTFLEIIRAPILEKPFHAEDIFQMLSDITNSPEMPI